MEIYHIVFDFLSIYDAHANCKYTSVDEFFCYYPTLVLISGQVGTYGRVNKH